MAAQGASNEPIKRVLDGLRQGVAKTVERKSEAWEKRAVEIVSTADPDALVTIVDVHV